MKAPLKSRRPSPEEALAIATSTAPTQPPAQVTRVPDPIATAPTGSVSEREPSTTLNLRVRMSTITALEAAARDRGMTMKQVVAHALRDAGIPIAEADLEDRTPRRKM